MSDHDAGDSTDHKKRIISPSGEEFHVLDERQDSVLAAGVPFIIVDMKEKKLSVKEGGSFLYSNLEGNVGIGNTSGFGLYVDDTRFLSVFEMKVNGREPVLLSSSADRDYMAHIELTNIDVWEGDKLVVPQETLNIRRDRVINTSVYERVRIKNYNPFPVTLRIEFAFNADFADMFEVRGQRAAGKGKLLQPKFTSEGLKLAYLGGDNVFRETRITFSDQPDSLKMELDRTIASYTVEIPARGRYLLNLEICPVSGSSDLPDSNFNVANSALRLSYQDWEETCSNIYTDNELFNSVVNRGKYDLRALLNRTPEGMVYDAGIPWFVAMFGRDSLITSLQTLMLNPNPARETLRILASHQGSKVDDWREEEPGKILHEVRKGELANLGEIPHTPYFGSVDSTLLFVIALGEYFRWTGDRALLTELKQNIIRALEWIDAHGDKDGDLFVEYQRRSARGLINQGWKDSYNAVIHTSGSPAEAPIALVEVQGYAYQAKLVGATLLRELGEPDMADKLESGAAELKKRFNEVFWLEEQKFLALALDGEKDLVETISSNPGHCLWSGIVDEDKAHHIADRLLKPDMYSGWGIRTMSKTETAYNPMSYHNGSIWPHDNSLIAAGFKKYGFTDAVNAVATGMFDAAIEHTYFRLPELFCGFTRRGNSRPVGYPVACSPQAWAAGAFFLMFQSMLGLEPDAANETLHIKSPKLPLWINSVFVTGLRVGEARVDLNFTRDKDATSFSVLRKAGRLKIIIEE